MLITLIYPLAVWLGQGQIEHTTLFFGMLLRLPLLIARHWRAR
jgi:hypothetical protein